MRRSIVSVTCPECSDSVQRHLSFSEGVREFEFTHECACGTEFLAEAEVRGGQVQSYKILEQDKKDSDG